MSAPGKNKPPPQPATEPPLEPTEESRIVIRPDGEVVIENLSELLAEVAVELDPDTDLACRIPQEEVEEKEDQDGLGEG